MAGISYDAGAAAYDRIAGRWSRLYVPTLLAGARLAGGQRVLDVATGTGEAAVLAVSAVGPSGRVIGGDISLPMLRAARVKAAGRPISFIATDGQALACRDASFDAVICHFGLMFFSDVAGGLAEFRRVLRPHGHVAVCVWSTAERVPAFALIGQALGRHLPAQREAFQVPYSLADADQLEGMLARAGFSGVRATRETRELIFTSFDDYWDPMEAGGGRLGQVYLELPEEARRAVRKDVRQRLAAFASGGRLVMEAEALIASGTR